MRRYRAELATATRAEHAEGPSWDARTGQLLWVDQYAGLVHVGDHCPADNTVAIARTYDLGAAVGAVVPSGQDDGWLVAYDAGFGHLARDGTVTPLAQPAPPHVRMNDGKCDGIGRFWAGTVSWDKSPGQGSLYRLDPDGTVTVAVDQVTISNGLAWADDGRTLFYIDTPTRRVDRFRVRTDGTLTERTPAIDVEGGFPDGMCIDVDGCLWVAIWGSGCARRYSPDGRLLAVVAVPAPQVSSCCLGGPDGRTLFLTTSQEGMSAEQRAGDAWSGAVFCVQVDVPGAPADTFGSATSGSATSGSNTP